MVRLVRPVLILAAAFSAASCLAAGVTVTPSSQEIEIAADQPYADTTVSLTNQSAIGESFTLSVVDFGTLNETGGVAFLGAPNSDFDHKYGLASWIQLDRNTVYVAPGSSADIAVRIENRSSLAPGGHYGAVLATAVTGDGSVADPHVNLRQVVAGLILARKDGGAVPDLKLVDVTREPGGSLRLPSQLELRFRDDGNVDVTPYGLITIKDPLGRTVRHGVINEESSSVFPESFRRIQNTLTRGAAAWLPGRYTIKVAYHFQGSTDVSYTTSFWYLGLIASWVIGLIAIVVVGAAAWFFWLRRRPRGRRFSRS